MGQDLLVAWTWLALGTAALLGAGAVNALLALCWRPLRLLRAVQRQGVRGCGFIPVVGQIPQILKVGTFVRADASRCGLPVSNSHLHLSG